MSVLKEHLTSILAIIISAMGTLMAWYTFYYLHRRRKIKFIYDQETQEFDDSGEQYIYQIFKIVNAGEKTRYINSISLEKLHQDKHVRIIPAFNYRMPEAIESGKCYIYKTKISINSSVPCAIINHEDEITEEYTDDENKGILKIRIIVEFTVGKNCKSKWIETKKSLYR